MLESMWAKILHPGSTKTQMLTVRGFCCNLYLVLKQAKRLFTPKASKVANIGRFIVELYV